MSLLSKLVVMNINVAKLCNELADVFLYKTEYLLVIALDLDEVSWLKLYTSKEASLLKSLLGSL